MVICWGWRPSSFLSIYFNNFYMLPNYQKVEGTNLESEISFLIKKDCNSDSFETVFPPVISKTS